MKKQDIWMTPAEYAAYHNITVASAKNRIKNGTVRVVYSGGKMFPMVERDSYVKKKRQKRY